MNFHQVGFCLCDTVQWRGSNKRRRFVRVVQLVVKITLGGCFHGGWTDIRGLMKLPSVHPALTFECFRGYIQCTPHLRTYEAIFSAPCSGIWGPSKLSLVQMNWHSSASVAVFSALLYSGICDLSGLAIFSADEVMALTKLLSLCRIYLCKVCKFGFKILYGCRDLECVTLETCDNY